jgi:hypothetical protein
VGDDASTAAGMIDAMTKHLIRRLRRNHGQEDRDPDRAEQVMLDVVDFDEPPLRLLLGSYALARAPDVVERQSAEDRKWPSSARGRISRTWPRNDPRHAHR